MGPGLPPGGGRGEQARGQQAPAQRDSPVSKRNGEGSELAGRGQQGAERGPVGSGPEGVAFAGDTPRATAITRASGGFRGKEGASAGTHGRRRARGGETATQQRSGHRP